MNEPKAPAPSFAIKGQYIKDLSFENPHSPQSLTVVNQKPTIDVNVDLRGERLQDSFYEMILHLSARATVENGTMFLIDLAYAGIFELNNIPEDRIEPLLWVDCPFVLFPFARRVIADITRDGGFPPLMLDPIDFHALYLHNKAKALNKTA
jgi:preprotein translocase subunit SecB